MSVMQIPGHEHQKPGEVMLEEIENILGQLQALRAWPDALAHRLWLREPACPRHVRGRGPGSQRGPQGRAVRGCRGHRLDALLSVAGLTREEVYIANVVKCRPPGNRNPKPEEIEACSPFLREQIRSVWPDVIVCLGNFASQWVLKTDKGVMSLRGQLYQQGHFVVAPTFHPAATLYHEDWQPLLEEDLARVGAWLAEHPADTSGEVAR